MSSVWRERIVFTGLGFLMAGGAFWALGGSGFWRTEPALDPAAETRPAGTEKLQEGSPARAPQCYLGVVLARDAVVVSAEIAGQLEEVAVRVGDRVRGDQVLAVLDTRNLEHQLAMDKAGLRTARAEHRRAELEVERAFQEEERRESLKDLLSKEEIAAARFERQQAEALFDAASAEIVRVEAQIDQLEETLARSRIRAPFDAVVAQRYLDVGAIVAQGTPVVRLISSEGLLARFAVPPEERAAAVLGTRVRIELEDLAGQLDGVVEHVAPELDAASQMIFVEARLEPASDATSVPSGTVGRVAVWTDDDTPPSCLDRSVDTP